MVDSDIFGLKDKVAIVTGGSGYLGKSFAEALVESGADVYITSRNKENSDKKLTFRELKLFARPRLSRLFSFNLSRISS